MPLLRRRLRGAPFHALAARALAVRALAAAAVLGLALAVAGPPRPALAQEQAALVAVDEVITEPMSQTAPVVGRIVARESVLAAQVAGTVARVHKTVGDRVAEGEAIVTLDIDRLEDAVALARADLQEAEASAEAAAAGLESARQELDRIRRLSGSAAFSQARLDDAEQALRRQNGLLRVAQARGQRAEVALRQAETDLEDAVVRAPFDGTVGRRDAHVGEYLRVGDPVVMLINDRDLEVEAAVATERVSALTPGREVTFTTAGGTTHRATVRAVVPLEDPATRTRPVRFDPHFERTETPLAGNEAVTVSLPVGRTRDVVTVHKDAVIAGARGRIVYVAVDGAAEMRPVELGRAVGNRFEVLDGLAPGDMVVVRGNERLRPGQPIRWDGAS
ncbi:MAG: efflux RND transporter periplasmic adaptor subunit [Azospirillaceae bacterium]